MVTRKDVAERAGVSPATVSYALTPGRSVSEATRARVLAAAAELGYVPNVMARGLAGGRTRALAMLIPPAERGVSESDMEYLVGAAEAAKALDHQVLLWPMDRHDVANSRRVNGGGLVGGVLLMEVIMQDERVGYLQEAGIPFALIGRTADPSSLLYADRDFDEVARLAVAHLRGLGHRRIAYLGSPESAYEFGVAAVIRSERAVREVGAAAGMEVAVMHCAHTPAAGREALANLLLRHPGTTAVISFNEEATFGLYHGAQAAGLRIPYDLSVVSTSVSKKRAALFHPALTAISPPALEIGGSAARALISALDELHIDPGPRLWAGTLQERASTGSAPGR